MTDCAMLVEASGEMLYEARFESIGAWLPAHRVTTQQLMASSHNRRRVDLERLSGVREHREASPTESSLSLAIAAARDCLSRSRYTGADLEVIIDASITRYVDGTAQRLEPPLSLSIKRAIGAAAATSFDLANANAGMLTGVFLLGDMIRRGAIQRGMVVSGERVTGLGTASHRLLGPPLASFTLGDGAAAVIVDRATEPGIRLAGFTLMLDDLLDRGGVHLGEVDWLIPHQTTVRDPEHIVATADEYGNTASTTLFLALHHHLAEHRFKRGDTILLVSGAAGLEIGAVLLVMDELETTHGRVH
jgi:3-oxoacyl-[acyl-carrier-protein] synthase-3